MAIWKPARLGPWLEPTPDGVGYVYRIMAGREVRYIGQTIDLLGRISTHRRERPAWWPDHPGVGYMAVPRADLDRAEGAEIHREHPAGNRYCPLCPRPARSLAPLGKRNGDYRTYRWASEIRPGERVPPGVIIIGASDGS